MVTHRRTTGGEWLTLTPPREVLLVDRDGNLVLRDEFQDKDDIEALQRQRAPADENPPGTHGGGGGRATPGPARPARPLDNLPSDDRRQPRRR